MEYIKSTTVITVPKKFMEFYTTLANFANDEKVDLFLLLNAIEARETDYDTSIKIKYEK